MSTPEQRDDDMPSDFQRAFPHEANYILLEFEREEPEPHVVTGISRSNLREYLRCKYLQASAGNLESIQVLEPLLRNPHDLDDVILVGDLRLVNDTWTIISPAGLGNIGIPQLDDLPNPPDLPENPSSN